MKKILFVLLVLCLPILSGHHFSSQTGIDEILQTTTGVAANGAGTGIAVDSTHPDAFSIEVIRTAGATDTVEVDLECSQDNSAWAQMNTVTSVAGGSNSVGNTNRACKYIRYNVVTVGAGNTHTITIAAFHAG